MDILQFYFIFVNKCFVISSLKKYFVKRKYSFINIKQVYNGRQIHKKSIRDDKSEMQT